MDDLPGLIADILADLESLQDFGIDVSPDGPVPPEGVKMPVLRIVYGNEDDDDPDEDEVEEADYRLEFGVLDHDVYQKHARIEKEHEYGRSDAGKEVPGPEERHRTLVEEAEAIEPMKAEYQETINHAHFDGLFGDAEVSVGEDMLNVEYESPVMINGQSTYQRIVIEVQEDMTVYELTRLMLSKNGVEASEHYDDEFGSMMFDSIAGKPDGEAGNFWEFYINGHIGEDSADKTMLKAGDLVEWRNAEESDGTCGGVPDFSQIKQMMQYSNIAGAYAGLTGPDTYNKRLSPLQVT